ncbi:MAG: Imm50 family immunity protein, partial [Planctomycetota bacterium]
EVPFLVDLRFHDCVDIEMSGFNHQNAIMSLSFEFESRGFLTDGTTPLLPYIRVQFEGAWGVSLAFRCFRVEVLGRREVSGQPHA